MDHVNAWGFYLLASVLTPLKTMPVGVNYTDDVEFSNNLTLSAVMTKQLVKGRATALFGREEYVSLPRSAYYAEKLRTDLDALRAKLFQTPAHGESEARVSSDDATGISIKIDHLERSLKHELETAPIFYVAQVGTHSVQDLLEHAELNLPKTIVSELTTDALNDIRQAGKCLALDIPTASGFHILRAVESFALTYVNKITGKPHPKKNRDWGAYIRVIRNTSGASPAVADYLYHMKETYRNPIMHPEVTLTPSDAFSLFNASLSAIIQLDAAIQAWP